MKLLGFGGTEDGKVGIMHASWKRPGVSESVPNKAVFNSLPS